MALTQSAWSVERKNGRVVATSTVAVTTAENDAYSLKTPTTLDPTKPWTLVIKTSAACDGAAVPVDLWVGYGDDFALSGNDNTVAATSGVKYKQLTDDVGYGAASSAIFLMDPNSQVADVVTIAAIATGYKNKVPVAPYYAFNLNAGSTMLACTVTFIVIQVL